MGAEIDVEYVKRWVLEGLSIADALERALEKAIEGVEVKRSIARREERRDQHVDVTEYIVEIERLKAQRNSLEARVRELEESLRDYERRLRDAQSSIKLEIARDAEISKLKSRVEALEREVERLKAERERLEEELGRATKAIAHVSSGELVLARRIPMLTTRNVRRGEEEPRVDAVIVDNANMFENEALAELARMGVRVVLLENLDSPLANALRERLIPVLDVRRYRVEEVHGVVLVESRVLRDAEVERERLKALRRPPDIERIIEEYRRERRRLTGRVK
jgi:predicted RNase H-like nuclease (RuvC/YqgF family)